MAATMSNMYVAILGVSGDNCCVACLNSAFDCVSVRKDLTKQDVVKMCSGSGGSAIPLNFGVANGKIAEDWGTFSRFKEGAKCVIAAEIAAPKGAVIGYRVISCVNGGVYNLKVQDLISKASEQKTPFIQNGIIRNGFVYNYPNKKYARIPVGFENTTKKAEPLYSKVVRQDQAEKQSKGYKPLSTEQKDEIALCKKHGVNPKLIANPDLSKDQMRVIWRAKENGAYAEAFNNPKMSTDVMKLYADYIVSKDIADEYSDLLEHPELSADEVAELCFCKAEGMDCKDLIGKSPVEIMIKREEATRDYWADNSIVDDKDYYGKAHGYAMKQRGF